MRLGSQTGSVTNHVLSRAVIGQPTPVVGMGATILCWTDRHAATIVEVRTIKGVPYITVQEDRATVVDGSAMDGTARYSYRPNLSAHKATYRQVDGGMWQEVTKGPTGRWRKVEGNGLRIGERQEYRDPSF